MLTNCSPLTRQTFDEGAKVIEYTSFELTLCWRRGEGKEAEAASVHPAASSQFTKTGSVFVPVIT